MQRLSVENLPEKRIQIMTEKLTNKILEKSNRDVDFWIGGKIQQHLINVARSTGGTISTQKLKDERDYAAEDPTF